jgi:hypothetical protein
MSLIHREADSLHTEAVVSAPQEALLRLALHLNPSTRAVVASEAVASTVKHFNHEKQYN